MTWHEKLSIFLISIVIVVGFSFVLMEIDSTQKYINDSISMNYQQMEQIEEELALLNDKILPTKIYVESLGEFRITYYCNDCDACGTNNVTADGTTLTSESRSVAVDKSVIPIGTMLLIEGVEFIANDTGGAIDGKRIDIMVYGKTHEEVNAMGVDTVTVYKILEGQE